jgi:hypothetical protein
MLALDVVIILGLLNHDDLVDTTLTGGSDGANVQVNVITLALTGSPGIKVHGLSMVGMVIIMVSVVLTLVPVVVAPGVEGEGVHERLAATAGLAGNLGRCGAGNEDNQANLGNSNHD